MLPADLKAKWLTNLRSGEFKQTTERFRKPGPKGEDCYCALGVLYASMPEAEKCWKRNKWNEWFWCGDTPWESDALHRVIEMNDELRLSFLEIADAVEKDKKI